jgi:hypothetical protein
VEPENSQTFSQLSVQVRSIRIFFRILREIPPRPFLRRGAPRPHPSVRRAYEMTMLPFVFPSLKPLMYGTYISGSSSTSGWRFMTGDGQELRAAGALAQPRRSVRLEDTVGGSLLHLAAGAHHGWAAAAPRVLPRSCGHRRRPSGDAALMWPSSPPTRSQSSSVAGHCCLSRPAP